MPNISFGGGLNNQDDFNIDPRECADGHNFLLDKVAGSFRPRPPQDLIDTATNASEIRGMGQLIKSDDTQFQFVQAGSAFYNWNFSTFTSLGSVNSASRLRSTTWSLDNFGVVTDLDLTTPVKKWDGSTLVNLTHGIAGVTDLYAKYSVVKDNRAWLFNIRTDSDYSRHVILVSAFEDAEDYDNSARAIQGTFATGNEAFFMVSPDLKPINGVAFFFNSIIISTESGKLYRLTGDGPENYAFVDYYSGSTAVGDESIANTGNDVVYMKQGGAIDSLAATDSSGDVSADDLSRWIPETVRGLSSCLTVYDQSRQQVLFFAGENLLVLDKEVLFTTNLSPWMVWTTRIPNGFSTESALYLRKDNGEYTVYWGDSIGNIYDLNGTGVDGDSSTYSVQATRTTRILNEEDTINDILHGRIEYRRKGACDMEMQFDWSEAYATTTCSVPLKGPIINTGTNFWNSSSDDIYWNESEYWNEGGVEDFKVSTSGFTASGKGLSYILKTTIDSTVNFLVNKIHGSPRN